jgi:hypothetical protein
MAAFNMVDSLCADTKQDTYHRNTNVLAGLTKHASRRIVRFRDTRVRRGTASGAIQRSREEDAELLAGATLVAS